MKGKKHFSLMAAGCLLVSTATFACLWDNDTIASESARFPEIPHLITGAFPRHSREFHEWRQKTSEQKLARTPSDLGLYDDLAVSQHKLGDHKAAIATMQAKEKIRPGVYETYSNLGTFYIYTGELEEALVWIRKALAINPNAHFGRERYQKWLVEWVLERRKNPEIDLEQTRRESRSIYALVGFARFVAWKESGNDSSKVLELSPTQHAAAIRGVTGMMRFADFNHPLLQEALGDLLQVGDLKENAAQLAALCYLQASSRTQDTKERDRLLGMFAHAGQFTSGFEKRQAEFTQMMVQGLAKGEAYFQTIRQKEIGWIAAGLDAGKEFQKAYLVSK